MPRQGRAASCPDLATSAGREAENRYISLRWASCLRAVVGVARPRSSKHALDLTSMSEVDREQLSLMSHLKSRAQNSESVPRDPNFPILLTVDIS